MVSTHQNQHGFSAIEGLLIVVIVGVIGFVGWYVYHTKQKTDTALSTATHTSNNAGPRFNSSKSTTASSGTDNQNLQTDLDSVNSASNQGSKDLGSANTSLKDASTFSTLPQ